MDSRNDQDFNTERLNAIETALENSESFGSPLSESELNDLKQNDFLDIKRNALITRFNGHYPFKSNEISLKEIREAFETILKNTRPEIRPYIMSWANQLGFLCIASQKTRSRLSQYYPGLMITSEDLLLDFKIYPDHVIYKERFLIKVPHKLQQNTIPEQDYVIIEAITKIAWDDNNRKIIHTLKNDEVYLLHKIENGCFAETDKNVFLRYGEKVETICNELDRKDIENSEKKDIETISEINLANKSPSNEKRKMKSPKIIMPKTDSRPLDYYNNIDSRPLDYYNNLVESYNQEWAPSYNLAECCDDITYFNNVPLDIVNNGVEKALATLENTYDEVKEYIRIHANKKGFLDLGYNCTRKYLDSCGKADWTITRLGNNFVENPDNYRDEFLGFEELLLIKNTEGNEVALINIKSSIEFQPKYGIIHELTQYNIHFRLPEAKNVFWFDIAKEQTEKASFIECYDKTADLIQKEIQRQIEETVSSNKEDKNKLRYAKAHLSELKLLNGHLFQHFDLDIAKLAIGHANRLKKSVIHEEWTQVDEAIRDLIVIIKANTTSHANSPDLINEYKNSRTYNKYVQTAFPLGEEKKEYIKPKDGEITTEEQAKLQIEATKNDVQYSDDLIQSSNFDRLCEMPCQEIIDHANATRNRFKLAVSKLNDALQKAASKQDKKDLRVAAINALNIAIRYENNIDMTEKRILHMSNWINNLANVVAEPDKYENVSTTLIKKHFGSSTEWSDRNNFIKEMQNVGQAVAVYKDNWFGRFFREQPILAGLFAGAVLATAAAIITALVISVIIASGGTLAVPVTGAAVFLGASAVSAVGATASVATTSIIGGIIMGIAAGVSSTFIGGLLGSVYRAYRKITDLFSVNDPAISELKAPAYNCVLYTTIKSSDNSRPDIFVWKQARKSSFSKVMTNSGNFFLPVTGHKPKPEPDFNLTSRLVYIKNHNPYRFPMAL